jgi:site-specific DNA recombinase
MERWGCEVEFLDHPMGRDPHDQLLLQIRGAVAEYERTLIAERMRRGRQRKLRAGGLLPWTRAPYGYRTDPDRPRDPAGVRLESAEAAVIAELFARYREQGMSLLRLAVDLSVRGTPTPRGHWRLPSGDPARHLEQPSVYGPGLCGAYPQSACTCAPLGHPCARPSDRGPCMHTA